MRKRKLDLGKVGALSFCDWGPKDPLISWLNILNDTAADREQW